MRGLTEASFGVVIAYLVPGLVALSAVSEWLPTVESWLGNQSENASMGGFLYGTLAALASGLTLSAIRWLTLDQLHHVTGLPAPKWDFSKLQQHFAAFAGAVENHFRYYQFYGNMLLAICLIPLAPTARGIWLSTCAGWMLGSVLIVVYFLASRDTLSKYYARTAAMLVSVPSLQEFSNDQRLPPSENQVAQDNGESANKAGDPTSAESKESRVADNR